GLNEAGQAANAPPINIHRDIPWKILVGLAIALFLPNSQEIVGASNIDIHAPVKPATPDEKSVNASWHQRGMALLRWRDTPQMAALFGVVFFVCLLKLREVSEFIYYQF